MVIVIQIIFLTYPPPPRDRYELIGFGGPKGPPGISGDIQIIKGRGIIITDAVICNSESRKL